jgi:hypothetical protein
MHTGFSMTKTFRSILTAAVFLALLAGSAAGQQKLAQTGMKFLNVGADARAVALGEAVTSLEGSSPSMFSNPASMARITDFATVSLARTQWIAEITHNYGSIAFAPWGGEYGVIGVFVQAVDYGVFQETILDQGTQGFLDIGTFRPTAAVFGLGYARALNDQFSVGGNLKYARQSLGDATVQLGQEKQGNSVGVAAFDLGILYRTGYKSLNFGMSVRNFAREIYFQKEGFQLPLTFKIGISMNVADLADIDRDMHGLLITLDAEHPRDYFEQVHVGAEYVFMKILALRVGFVSPADEYNISYGVGLRKAFEGLGFGLDYAYTPFGIFGGVHRFSFDFSL